MRQFYHNTTALGYFFANYKRGQEIRDYLVGLGAELQDEKVCYNNAEKFLNKPLPSLLKIFKEINLSDAEMLNEIITNTLELRFGVILSTEIRGKEIVYRSYNNSYSTIRINLQRYTLEIDSFISYNIVEEKFKAIVELACGVKLNFRLPVIKQEDNYVVHAYDVKGINFRGLTDENNKGYVRTIVPELYFYNDLMYPNVATDTVINAEGEIITCPLLICVSKVKEAKPISVVTFFQLIRGAVIAHILTKKKDSVLDLSYNTGGLAKEIYYTEPSLSIHYPATKNPKMKELIQKVENRWGVYATGLPVTIKYKWPDAYFSQKTAESMLSEIKYNNLRKQKHLSEIYALFEEVGIPLNI